MIKKYVLYAILVVCLGVGGLLTIKHKESMSSKVIASTLRGGSEGYKLLPKAGEKCWLSDDQYFIYGFDKKPRLGTVFLKIQVFTKSGEQDSTLEITGDSGMPSMRGAHDSGPQPFKLNKKGDYLLPVNIVMPGDWEVKLDFIKDRKVIYMGSIRFDV